MKKLEDVVTNHQRELAAVKMQTGVVLPGMHEMDDMIAGKLLGLLRLLLHSRLPSPCSAVGSATNYLISVPCFPLLYSWPNTQEGAEKVIQ